MDVDKKQQDLSVVETLILRIQETEFYGKVQLLVRKGELVQIETGQTYKPEQFLEDGKLITLSETDSGSQNDCQKIRKHGSQG